MDFLGKGIYFNHEQKVNLMIYFVVAAAGGDSACHTSPQRKSWAFNYMLENKDAEVVKL